MKIYLGRIGKFYRELGNQFFHESRTFDAAIAVTGQPVSFAERNTLAFSPLREGDRWGKLWDSAWVKLQGHIPEAWRGKPIVCRLNLGGEALIFDAAGMPLYGLTNSSVFASQYRKELYFLPENQAEPGALELEIEVGANGLFGAESNPDFPEQGCDVGHAVALQYGVFNTDVWHLKLDAEIVLSLLNLPRYGADFVAGAAPLRAGSREEARILATLLRAIDIYRNDPARAALAREELRKVLGKRADASALRVTAVGHAHIDTGWLWPVRESIRKCARTFASQLRMLERYPDYIFGASQAQHYAFVKQHYPALYAKIKEQVAAGRWEIQGGMWVESDCNLTGGESLVRQFLHGKNFFRDEFGVDVKNLWLPDVFGYSANLPQICVKAGCENFLTQKLCWNEHNKFPYHAFRWHGLGDYSVLCFFPPEDTYNTLLVPDQLTYGADNFEQNDRCDEILSLFGIGDGGGGPKEEYLERGLRCRDLEHCPRVEFGRADAFFERLARQAPELPEYHGELYFEKHRGTLTSQAESKRLNRRAEQELAETEFLATLNGLEQYPAEALDRAWKLLLLNQFHDIIPGSSIHMVYEDSYRDYAELFRLLAEVRAEAVRRNFDADDNALVLVNTLSCAYTRAVEFPAGWEGARIECNGVQTQVCNGAAFLPLAPHSVNNVVRLAGTAPAVAAEVAAAPDMPAVLENELIRYEFGADGTLTHIFDKVAGKVVSTTEAPGNVLALYLDEPTDSDAWDIGRYYLENHLENARLTARSAIRRDACRSTFAQEFTVGGSQLVQHITLEHNSRRLEFSCRVEWREKHRMLRVAFPVAVTADRANFDIQYGFISRTVHENDSIDRAQFECCAHRYADLSDARYGAALLNDCKYGYRVHGNVLDLCLLRSPLFPDPEADRGTRIFTYALLPHEGTLPESPVMREAAMLNRPVRRIDGHRSRVDGFGVKLAGGGSVTLEVLKKAEKEAAWIVRLNETFGRTESAWLQLPDGVTSVAECDLMEWRELSAPPVDCGRAQLEFAPFEIKTLKIKLKG